MGRTEKNELSNDSPRLKGLLRFSQVILDLVMLVLAFALGYLARRELPLIAPVAPIQPPDLLFYIPILVLQTATMLAIFFLARLYHQRRAVSRIDQAYTIAASISIGVVMTNGLTSIVLKGTDIGSDYPRQMILYVWLFSIIGVLIGRELHRQLAVRLRVMGLARDRVVIVGSGEIAQALVQHIQHNPQLGYRIVGAVNGPSVESVAGVPIIGTPDDLPRLIDQYQVDEVIIALPDVERLELTRLVAQCQRGRVSIKIYPDLFAYMEGGMSVDELGGLPLLSVRDVALRGWKLTLKRAVDVLGATLGLIVLSPFLLLTAILVKLGSPGPAFFCQERTGLDGRPFPMIKFRSMRSDAEKTGPGWTTQGDPRVTRLGSWMRKHNWDEWPNLINVLLGHMSLVGPRPEQVHFVEQFQQHIPRYMERHREKSGMTGWAQVNGMRGDTSIEERIKYDLWYVEHWSIGLDIKIIIRTGLQMLLGKSENAY
jgi:exopolysaccharide biosynthesis polyprenyl glycosylphosphotransferase